MAIESILPDDTASIIEAVDSPAGLIALLLLVISGLAIPMTKGVTPNARAGLFVFLAVGFFGATVWAFLPYGSYPDETRQPADAGAAEDPAGSSAITDADPAPPFSPISLSVNQPVAKGNRLNIGQDYYLVVTRVGNGDCDIAVRAQDTGALLTVNLFAIPEPYDFEEYRIFFTRTGTAALRSVCYFDIQQIGPLRQAGTAGPGDP